MDAPLEGLTDIGRAWIAVIAVDRPHGDADPLPTHVEVGALVSVLAVGLVRGEDAADLRGAGVIGASVLIVALEWRTAAALSV